MALKAVNMYLFTTNDIEDAAFTAVDGAAKLALAGPAGGAEELLKMSSDIRKDVDEFVAKVLKDKDFIAAAPVRAWREVEQDIWIAYIATSVDDALQLPTIIKNHFVDIDLWGNDGGRVGLKWSPGWASDRVFGIGASLERTKGDTYLGEWMRYQDQSLWDRAVFEGDPLLLRQFQDLQDVRDNERASFDKSEFERRFPLLVRYFAARGLRLQAVGTGVREYGPTSAFTIALPQVRYNVRRQFGQ